MIILLIILTLLFVRYIHVETELYYKKRELRYKYNPVEIYYKEILKGKNTEIENLLLQIQDYKKNWTPIGEFCLMCNPYKKDK